MAVSMPSDGPAPIADSAAGGGARRLTVGVSGLYLALYLHYGFFAFMPLWLKKTGAAPGEIGVLMAIPLILRLLTVAPFSTWAGKNGRVRDAIVVTALLSAVVVALLLGQPGHIGRIAVVIAFSIVWDQIPVLTDAYAVIAVRANGLDFGRMRVWGSIAVVVSNVVGGWAFGLFGIETLPLICAGLLLLPAGVAALLPSDRVFASVDDGPRGSWRDVIADRKLMRAMAAASMIVGSHGVITNFGAIQWADHGISTANIGVLQAVAVAAEIVAFWFGAKLLGGRDPSLLLCIAAAAAALRWIVMATNPALPVLFATQLLQGVTATGAILGIMLVIAKRVPVQTSAAAQGLNAVLFGVVLAAATVGSGLLWSYGVTFAYLSMAVLAAFGIVLAWPSRSIDTPEKIDQPRRPVPFSGSASGADA